MSIEAICKRLKEARIRKGFLSARNFALCHKIPDSTYTQHESGKRKISIETLLYYSELLQVTPSWLLTGKEEKPNRNSYSKLKLPLSDNTSSTQKYDEYTQVDLELLSVIIYNMTSYPDHKDYNHDKIISTSYAVYNSLIDSISENSTNDQITMAINNFFKQKALITEFE